MKKILFLTVYFILVSQIYAHDFLLTSIKTNENTVSVYRGKSVQTISNDDFLISMLATKTDKGIQFSTSITNFSSDKYFFDEKCITVYEGNYENSLWSRLNYIPASLYLTKEKSNIKTEEVLAAISLGLSAGTAGYSTVNGSGYINGSRYTYSANIYSPADAAIAMTNSYIALDNMQQRNQDYLTFLENNLLFSSEINSLDNYNGIFIVNEKNGPDYKVIIELSPNEKFTFYFTRSDKDEILNPWKDKSHSRHSIVAGISPTFHHFSLYYLWSQPKGVGFYTGISLQKESTGINYIGDVYSGNDISTPEGYELGHLDPAGIGYYNYDWKFDYDKSTLKYDAFGFYGGITIKTFSNTWLLLGIGMDIQDSLYYNGTLYYKRDSYSIRDTTFKKYSDCWLKQSSYEILFSPQLGLNFITNHLDIGAMITFPINGKVNFDILLGYTF